MKIGNINVRISIIAIAVVVIFAILLSYTYMSTHDPMLLAFGIPCVVLLLVIPMALNYMSQKQYMDLIPEYEREARPVRIRMINLGMHGQVVRLEGVVERTYFQFPEPAPVPHRGQDRGDLGENVHEPPGECKKKAISWKSSVPSFAGTSSRVTL